MSQMGRVSRASSVQTAVRNCARDKGRPFGIGNQVEQGNNDRACGQVSGARDAVDGGLMFYGVDQRFLFCDGATYVGTKVSELPVQLATKFELVINLKTAKARGLTVLQDLLSIADEVIE